MFDKLIPWKTQDRGVKVGYDDHSLGRLRNEFDHLWDRFWDDWRNRALSGWDDARMFGFGSSLHLDDNEGEYLLRAEVPGFEPDDFDVKISGNLLTVRAERTENGEGKNGNGRFHRYGSFSETFTIPQGVLCDRIDARYHSGVLEVHLPKSEECKAKRIAVKSA